MKKSTLLLPFTFLLLSFGNPTGWTKDQLIHPAELAKTLSGKPESFPLIFNIGPMEQIKSSIKIGVTNNEEGIKTLNNKLISVEKNKEIIIYCGCCSSENCPNIKPAYDYIMKQGYSKVKVLDIPVGLGEDWKAKGYPMN